MEKKMIRSDNHVHTSFSSDSYTPMEDMVIQGKSLGLSSICFTDHMDYGFPVQENGMDFLFSVEDYFSTIRELSGKHPDFPIRTGVELGLKKDVLPAALKLTKENAFDFVIGSTHLVDDIDPYDREYWESHGEENGLQHYYETTLQNIREGFDYDVYGHIDYAIRYCPSMNTLQADTRQMEAFYQKMLKKNRDILDEILSALLSLGKGIEINTAGWKRGLGHPNPHEAILKRYAELGGEIITIGSDAHETRYLAYDFAKVPTLLQSCGFSSYTEFHGRKPLQISLL